MLAVESILSLLLLVAAGFIIRRVKWVDESGLGAMSNLVLFVAIPSVAIAKLQREPTPELVRDLIATFALSFALMLATGALGWLIFRKEPPRQRSLIAHLSIFSNCGFMGYPVVTALFGESALIYAVVVNAAFNLLAWTFGVILLNKGAELDLRKALLTPALVGAAMGIVFFAFRVRLPGFLVSTLDTLGSLTTPLSMMVIGARMVGQSPRELIKWRVWALSALRLMVFPLITYGVCRLCRASDIVCLVVAILAGMPHAAVTAMQAIHYKHDSIFASNCVALSTLLSMITIPVLCLLLNINAAA
ncbi:MAG: AEC family transporter [Oscillospiraceae bacterium]|jgi:predicted permease|nr:AEC family transporter [Oscillospiraceae bacterium]